MISKLLKQGLRLQSQPNLFNQTSLLSCTHAYFYGTQRQRDNKRTPFKSKTPTPKLKESSSSSKKYNEFDDLRRKPASSPQKIISKYPTKPYKETEVLEREFESDAPAAATMPFDLFTQELALRSKEEVLQELEEALEENMEKDTYLDGLPWAYKDEPMREDGNLETPLGLSRLMNFEVATKLFENYVEAIETGEEEGVKALLEHTFAKKMLKNVEDLKSKGHKVVVEGRNSLETDIDLFQVTNFFCVGVHSNRKKNLREEKYQTFYSMGMDMPLTNIVIKKAAADDMAVLRVIVDLYIKTPVWLKIVDSSGKEILRAGKQGEINYHHMRIENDVLEIEYRSLKKSIEKKVAIYDKDSDKTFKMLFSHDKWRIIDFDNYMKGNEPLSYKP